MFIYKKASPYVSIDVIINQELSDTEIKYLEYVFDNISNGEFPFYGANEFNLTNAMIKAAIGTSENLICNNDGIKYSR